MPSKAKKAGTRKAPAFFYSFPAFSRHSPARVEPTRSMAPCPVRRRRWYFTVSGEMPSLAANSTRVIFGFLRIASSIISWVVFWVGFWVIFG